MTLCAAGRIIREWELRGVFRALRPMKTTRGLGLLAAERSIWCAVSVGLRKWSIVAIGILSS
jgi:hypothetical protein